jgi:hypothetical protein
MKDRSILKPVDFEKIKGTIEAHQYRFDEKRQLWIKQIRLIKGVAKARSKAPKFVLYYELGKIKWRVYVAQDEAMMTSDIKQAKLFYEGFDDPETRKKQWEDKLGIKLTAGKYFERNENPL